MVVKTTSGLEACKIVDMNVIDFGNNNNWYSICGAVSQDNELYIHEEDKKDWLEGMETIEKINTEIRVAIKTDNGYEGGKSILDSLINGEKKKEEINSIEWYAIKQYAFDMGNRFDYNGRDKSIDFDIIKGDEYKYSHFDEFGVSQHHSIYDEENGKLWIVFIDMHS
jgi:hypothetical protein